MTLDPMWLSKLTTEILAIERFCLGSVFTQRQILRHVVENLVTLNCDISLQDGIAVYRS